MFMLLHIDGCIFTICGYRIGDMALQQICDEFVQV